MGLKFSKQGPLKAENQIIVHVQRRLINYLSASFHIRNLVSKKRRRMLVGGYDLDMTYITDRVLAMSFPAERMRAMYRNPLWQVKSVLDMRHQGCYKYMVVEYICVGILRNGIDFYMRGTLTIEDENWKHCSHDYLRNWTSLGQLLQQRNDLLPF